VSANALPQGPRRPSREWSLLEEACQPRQPETDARGSRCTAEAQAPWRADERIHGAETRRSWSTPGGGGPLHVEQRCSETAGVMNAVLQIDRDPACRNHVIRGGVVCRCGRRNRTSPGSARRSAARSGRSRSTRTGSRAGKISTMTKVSISHFVLMPMCVRVDIIRSSPPSNAETRRRKPVAPRKSRKTSPIGAGRRNRSPRSTF